MALEDGAARDGTAQDGERRRTGGGGAEVAVQKAGPLTAGATVTRKAAGGHLPRRAGNRESRRERGFQLVTSKATENCVVIDFP